ncbi:hypothetical protein [Cesiribacter andamanensis]|uniref:P-type conjugative transfer protein TrbJ n=1 Tax=Cesiribacter andamanensis AMV16 TaxID=1279009 RepID=M7N0G4_9BACT|nr:hypothetical protein [Cesiribacter andamanensis]EMR00711.1 hypothetical protein ADICEAN_04170 [Cesiribacter andamanensis AMV16]
MKAIQLKKSLCLLLVLLAFSATRPLQAQFVVYDPVQFTNMVKSLANEVQLISTAAKTLQETKDILNTAIRTKQEIENIYRLQWQVQEALKVAQGIKDLKWSDLDELTRAAMGLVEDPLVYLPELTGTDRLRQVLQREPTLQTTRQLHGLLVGISSQTGPLQDLVAYEAISRETTLSQFALAEMREQKQIQAALSYAQLADDMIYQARELMEAVKRDQRFSMNEAERLHSLRQCQEVMLKSMEIKLEADQLLRSVTEQPSRAREELLQSYRNQLLRKALAEEPQMKYGQP